MLKNILKLEGAQQLSKNEQKTINGGITRECSNALSYCTNVARKTLAQCNALGGDLFCGYCCF
ncbi:hypothetical protein [Flavobacterium sp.]|uniref:hypothetical protein n=1 Tax=Flavobacterium sp. TaxID=239 RepID=UPI00286DBA5D|nr:hypothetical protein [Flavobacterium sp.]